MIRALTWTKAIRNSVIEKCLDWSEGIKSLGSNPDHTRRQLPTNASYPSVAEPCFDAKGMSGA
jgi:hypothetical protein